MLCPPGRAKLTSLPQEVLEMIVNLLHGNDKVCGLPSLHNRGAIMS